MRRYLQQFHHKNRRGLIAALVFSCIRPRLSKNIIKRYSVIAVLAVLVFTIIMSSVINFIIPSTANASTPTFKYTNSNYTEITGPTIGTGEYGYTSTYYQSGDLYIATLNPADPITGCTEAIIKVSYPGASSGYGYEAGDCSQNEEPNGSTYSIQGGGTRDQSESSSTGNSASGPPTTQTEYAQENICNNLLGQTTAQTSLSDSQASTYCVKGALAALTKNAKAYPTSPKCDGSVICDAYLVKQGYCYTLYPSNTNSEADFCQIGYDTAYNNRSYLDTLPVTQTASQAAAAAKLASQTDTASQACSPNIPGAANSNQLLQDCEAGYIGGLNGESESKACSGLSGIDLQFCQQGYGYEQAANTPSSPSGSGLGTSCNFGISTSSGFSGFLNSILSDVNPLNWLLCGIIAGASSIVKGLDGVITSWLTIGTNGSTSTDNPGTIFSYNGGQCGQYTSDGSSTCDDYHSAWSAFEELALGLLAILALMIIIAQALGMELLDAYTIRKMLPRVVTGAIILTISWPLMRFFVLLSNDLGYGVGNLLWAPFSNLKDTINTGGILQSLIGAVALLTLGWFGLLSFLGTAALAVLVAFLTLVFRQIAVILLIIFSPIAILCYALPNTQRIFRFWWESFSKMLLMFPMIVAFITVGHIFSALASQNQGSGVDQLIAVIAYFAPYFTIPFTFRFSGSIMSGVGNYVNSRAEPARGALRNFRTNRAKHNLEKLASGERFNEDVTTLGYDKFAKRFNALSKGTANLKNAGFNPARMRSRMQNAAAQRDLLLAQEGLEKNPEAKLMTDDLYEAMMPTMESHIGSGIRGGENDAAVRAFLKDRFKDDETVTDRDIEQGVATVRSFRRSMGNHRAASLAAVIGNSRTGTGFQASSGGGGAMNEAIIHAAGPNDRWLMDQTLIAARAGMSQERRVDVSGGSFTKHENLLLKQARRGVTRAEATEQLSRNGREGQSAGAIMSARRQAVEAIVPQMRVELHEMLETPHLNPDGSVKTDEQKVREAVQQLAVLSSSHDVAAQVAPENGQLLADTVMREQINVGSLDPAVRAALQPVLTVSETVVKRDAAGNPIQARDAAGNPAVDPKDPTKPVYETETVGGHTRSTISAFELMNAVRNNPILGPTFQEMHKEYYTTGLAEAAAAQQQQAAAAAGGVPPGGPPPIPGVPAGP